MQVIWSEQALTDTGWARNVRIEIGDDGRVAHVAPDRSPEGHLAGLVLPAPANSHSHAFQRAMAGLTEARGAGGTGDSFWTWRQLMFRFLDRITPDQVEAIAALVQMEMLEAGYATNVEFHYLHHQPGGAPYARLGEMSDRIAAAARMSGIGLTLLPVHYQFGGCDQSPPGPGQIRFRNDPDSFARLVEDAAHAVSALPRDAVIGVAPHSLRAVSARDAALAGNILGTGPVHMHLAEQIGEVEEVTAKLGARPVEWALDHLPLDDRWCLIHCTQMMPHETRDLAGSGVVAGLCPLTEASLGDGIFDAVRWMDNGGRISIGSDSNVRIALNEELRLLETTQRLRDHGRAALASADQSTGRRLFEAICRGGAQAAGRGSGTVRAGEWADLLSLDCDHVDLAGLTGDTALDAMIFAGGQSMVRDVWSAGRHMVRDGRHVQRADITRAYASAVADLRDAI